MPHPKGKGGSGAPRKICNNVRFEARLFVDLKIAYSKSKSVIQKMRTKMFVCKNNHRENVCRLSIQAPDPTDCDCRLHQIRR